MNPRRRSPESARSAHARAIADAPDLRRRGLWLVLAFSGDATAVFGRLVQVQIIQGKSLARGCRCIAHVIDHAARHPRCHPPIGNGRVLREQLQVFDVFVDRHWWRRPIATRSRAWLAPICRIHLRAGPACAQPAESVRLSRQGVSQDVNDKLQALGLSGIGTVPSEESIYEPSPVPGVSFAANLLGFVNGNGAGQYGLEGYYNSILSGINGHESTLTDVNGNAIVLGQQQKVAAENGDNLELGLDSADPVLGRAGPGQRRELLEVVVGDADDHGHQDWRDRRVAQYPSYNANSYASANIADFRTLRLRSPMSRDRS